MSFSKLSETPIGPIDCPPWAGTVHLATPIPQCRRRRPTHVRPPNAFLHARRALLRSSKRMHPPRLSLRSKHRPRTNAHVRRRLLARAGFGVVFAPVQWYQPISNCLEQDGNAQTNNRAELRAVLAAIGLRWWYGEGFKKIVIACHSEYVINGS